MIELVEAGPNQPLPVTPVLPPGAVRRTWTIDTHRPGDLMGQQRTVATGRDALRRPDGELVVIAEQTVDALVDFRSMLEVSADPPVPGLVDLVGVPAAGGFRAALIAALGLDAAATLPFGLVDDFPGALLVAGYSLQREGLFALKASEGGSRAYLRSSVDICAGWSQDATIQVVFREQGEVPTPIGPESPSLVHPDDPEGWHSLAPLAPKDMRRARRLDVLAPVDGVTEFRTHFRDSFREVSGREIAIHEYTVDGSIDAAGVLVSIDVRARVLPWSECPQAVASGSRLVGSRIDQAREVVRSDFRGVSTCTHLNDCLRVLADLPALRAVQASLLGR